MEKRELLLEFFKWYLNKHHKVILPNEVMEEIVDNFLTFDSYYKLNNN